MNKTKKYLILIVISLLIISLILILAINQDGISKTEIKIDNWAHNYVGFDSQKNSEPIKIAILDSGIYKKHKEFNGLTFREFNAIEPGVKIKDDFGHGTAIAGIIAARGIETTGVITNVIIYDVKVLNEKGEGKIDDVVEGIEWSIKQNVDIINISFGFSSDTDSLIDSIEKAVDQNIIITAAAGNTLGLSVDYPASYNNVLSISSFDENFQFDPLSATGKIDYSAPGVNITSTDNNGGYTTYSGTSFATAFATGAIASILNIEGRTIKASSFKSSLSKYVLPLGQQKYFGDGFITLEKEKVKVIINEKETY